MWRTVKLGEICNVRRGATITKKNTVAGVVPVIGGGTKPTYFHNEANRDAGCITVSGSGASAGFVNYWDTPIFASDCSTVEIKTDELLQRFVYYFMQSQQQYIYENFRSGAAQPHVYAKDIATLEIPVITPAEQQRIVAKLDAAFAEIDKAIGLTKSKEDEVAKLRASLLSNSLTDNALMWSNVKLSEICKMYQPKTISAKEMVAEGEYVVFGANGIIGKYHKYNHAEPQLLVTCRGATCGAVNVSDPFSWINGNAMVIQPDFDEVTLKYMEYVFRGGIDLSKAITGAAQPQITRKSLEHIKFSYPTLAEQQRIVAKLDSAFSQLENFEASIAEKFKNLNALKSAILAQELESEAA